MKANLLDIIESLKEISESCWWLNKEEHQKILEAMHLVSTVKHSVDERIGALKNGPGAKDPYRQ